MLILSIHAGLHDTSAALFDGYHIVAAVQKERLARRKKAGGSARECIAEVLACANARLPDVGHAVFSRAEYPAYLFTTSNPLLRLRDRLRYLLGGGRNRDISTALMKSGRAQAGEVIDGNALLAFTGLAPGTGISFSNHHFAHTLPTLFFTDWPDALLYTADGAGDGVNFSHYLFQDGKIENLFGDDRWLHQPYRVDSLARAYANVTEGLGFRPLHHEGKITGLSAFGEATLLDRIRPHFSVDEMGRVNSDFATASHMRAFILELCRGEKRENVAASIQDSVEEIILLSVQRLVERTGVRHLGLAGGLFANVKLNRRLAENCPLDEIFVMPPMGDEGLVIGGALDFLLARDGLEEWLANRHRLEHVYWGRDYSGNSAAALRSTPGIRKISENTAAETARLLHAGKIVALYRGRMEYGPRALGGRSILAAATDRRINDSLNARLERTEFMPFAPVVADADAADIFAVGRLNRYACRFMTITCEVHAAWREKIPAIVHVDNTARPQIIERQTNPLYFDILAEYKKISGIPVLINTSFNAHEEPIINTPSEATRSLLDGRVDFLATEDGIYGPAG